MSTPTHHDIHSEHNKNNLIFPISTVPMFEKVPIIIQNLHGLEEAHIKYGNRFPQYEYILKNLREDQKIIATWYNPFTWW